MRTASSPRPDRPPERTARPYPTATALIAAYLPNEAATLIETVEKFLAIDYPGQLQIILAYNTPHPMPIEEILVDIAHRDQRFVSFRVDNSTSKADNVNARILAEAWKTRTWGCWCGWRWPPAPTRGATPLGYLTRR